MRISILILNLFIFSIYADISNNANGITNNTSNYEINKNIEEMYNFIKSSNNCENILSPEANSEYKKLKPKYKEYKKSNKKVKLDEESIRKVENYKKIIASATFNKNINDIFVKSKFFPELMDSTCEWTVDELKALNILKYNEKDKGILNQIDLNFTETGYFANAIKLINNQETVDVIQERLNILQDVDIDELEQMYKVLKDKENKFMNFFSDDEAYNRFKMGDNKFNVYIDLRDKIIKKTSHANRKFVSLFLNPHMIFFLTIHILTQSLLTGNLTILKFFFGAIFDCNIYKELLKKTNILVNVLSIIICIFNYYLLFNIIYKFYQYFNPYRFYYKLAKAYKTIKTYISAIEKIFNIFQNNENLMYLFQDKLQYTRNFFIDNVDYSKEQIELRRILTEIPADWKYWKYWGKARAGKLCKLLYLFDRNKEIFINIIFEIANIESYIKVVKMFNNKYYNDFICKPKFGDTYSNPIVILNKAWNPFINKDEAVTNDITLGINTKDNVSTAILYGMNAGGKTTTLDSIGLSYIFGRSFGFSFAKEAEFSYLKRLYITKDIGSDIKNRCSKFMSETISIDKLLNLINNLKEKEFCLFLSDELFSGTNPETANELSVNVIKNICKNKNVLTVFSTHNIKPTELYKENELIKNYIMDIDLEDDNINYKYKFIKYDQDTDELLNISRKIATNLVKKMHKSRIIKNGDIIIDENV